jgi:hypothetical protein
MAARDVCFFINANGSHGRRSRLGDEGLEVYALYEHSAGTRWIGCTRRQSADITFASGLSTQWSRRLTARIGLRT